jgi:predicted ribonuclease toxin of YeeF-YezG toxin-antitoxin module
MGSPDEVTDEAPLMEPRLVRLLKNRQRLIDMGMREEFLSELETIMTERRKPDRVAQKATDEVLTRAQEATREPVRRRLKDRVDDVNNSLLRDI